MRNRILFFILVLVALIPEANAQYCTSDARYTEVAFFDATEITNAANVQYGIALDYLGNPDTLLMDLYYPNLAIDPSPKRPFVLLFHGGGFVSGDKQSGDIRDLCIHMARRGFVCASANYRLGNAFPEYNQYKARYRAIQDGHAAMRFAVNNANAVRIDTNWLFVGGQSAGSLLALGMVYADPSELDSLSLLYNATAVSAELGNLYTSGNNLTTTYTLQGVFNNWGGITASEVDPSEMLPTVAFHGALDTTVRIDADNAFAHYTLLGSRALHNELIAKQICSELTVDTLGEHGIYRNAASEFRAGRASCFFKSVFCSTCASLSTTDSIPPTCSIPTSVADKLATAIRVYPNPSEGAFQIAGVDGYMDVRIYNSLGQLVYQDERSQGRVQAAFLPGIYVLHVKALESGRVFTAKLIQR